MPEDPLVARVRAAGITPNPETEFCRAWRRVLPVYTPAYDIACQGLWYLACGLMMVPTPIVFGGGEKRTDTRQSVALVAQTGAGKDAMINAVMKQLRAASPEVRIENMSVSHEEQLRGGSRKIQVEVKVETGTKAEKTPEGGGDKPPTRKRTLWLPQYGILGSDLGYMKEGLRLTTDPRYETHREYLRDALNPYGENWIGKRLSGVTFGKGLSYCSPVVIILGFQPGELPADFTSRGLGRRMLALMASLSSAALRRVTTRGWLGPARDPVRDMGVFDSMEAPYAERVVREGLTLIGKTFWSRPFNSWILKADGSGPRADIAALLNAIELEDLDRALVEVEFEAIRSAAERDREWEPRQTLPFTADAGSTACEVENLVVDQIAARGDRATQYVDYIRTTAQNLLARLAGITAGVAIATGDRELMTVQPEDVLACALDFREFLDMGLALVLGQTGEPFHKPLRDDVMWVVQYVRDRQLLGNVLAAEVTAAYAKAKLGNGWRAWDRVRQELRELGLAKTPPAGKGQDVRLELTETGLAVAVAGGEAR